MDVSRVLLGGCYYVLDSCKGVARVLLLVVMVLLESSGWFYIILLLGCSGCFYGLLRVFRWLLMYSR